MSGREQRGKSKQYNSTDPPSPSSPLLPPCCYRSKSFSLVIDHFFFHFRRIDIHGRCLRNHLTRLHYFLPFTWSSSFYAYTVKIAMSENSRGTTCESICKINFIRVDLRTGIPICTSQTLVCPGVSHKSC